MFKFKILSNGNGPWEGLEFPAEGEEVAWKKATSLIQILSGQPAALTSDHRGEPYIGFPNDSTKVVIVSI